MVGNTPPEQAVARRLQWQRIALVVCFVLVLWVFLHLFSSVLTPFVVSAGLAYFLDPAVRKLDEIGVRRSVGALLIMVGAAVILTVLILLLYPVVEDQMVALAANLPNYINTAEKQFGHLVTLMEHRIGPGLFSSKLQDLAANQAGEVVTFAGSAARNIIGSGFAVVNVLTLVVITPIVTFYFLRDWPAIVHHVDTWLPRRYEGTIRAQAGEINRILAAWLRGQAICCVVLAFIYSVGLTIVGLNFGLTIGIAAGLLSFIPYVGTLLGVVVSILLSLSQGPSWGGVINVAIVFAIGQALNDYVIQPRFLGDRVGLPAVWVIFSLFAGGAAFGFLGIMLAVPVTATLGVLARFWLRRYLASPLYMDTPDLDARVE